MNMYDLISLRHEPKKGGQIMAHTVLLAHQILRRFCVCVSSALHVWGVIARKRISVSGAQFTRLTFHAACQEVVAVAVAAAVMLARAITAARVTAVKR